MKAIKITLAILINLILLSSCSSDNKSSDNGEVSIIGQWKLVGRSSEKGAENSSECDLKSNTEFRSNLTGESNMYHGTIENCDNISSLFEYSINNNQLTMSSPAKNFERTFDFTVTSSTLTFRTNGEQRTFDTIKFIKVN